MTRPRSTLCLCGPRALAKRRALPFGVFAKFRFCVNAFRRQRLLLQRDLHCGAHSQRKRREFLQSLLKCHCAFRFGRTGRSISVQLALERSMRMQSIANMHVASNSMSSHAASVERQGSSKTTSATADTQFLWQWQVRHACKACMSILSVNGCILRLCLDLSRAHRCCCSAQVYT